MPASEDTVAPSAPPMPRTEEGASWVGLKIRRRYEPKVGPVVRVGSDHAAAHHVFLGHGRPPGALGALHAGGPRL
jgi:hypothetical protein